MKKHLIVLIIVFAGLTAQAQLSATGNATLVNERPVAGMTGSAGLRDTLGGRSTDEVTVAASTNVTIDGQWSWVMNSAAKNTHVTGYRITNHETGGTSGTLKLKLFFTTSPYTGGSITGWVMFDYTLGVLPANNYFHDIDLWSNWTNPPAPGVYYSSLLLLEYDNGTFYIIDHLSFPDQINFNTSGVEDLNNNNRISISQIINSNSILIKIPQSLNPNVTLKVFDINGKIVHQTQLNDYSNTIDLSFLNSGIYISYINNDINSLAKQKIIITK